MADAQPQCWWISSVISPQAKGEERLCAGRRHPTAVFRRPRTTATVRLSPLFGARTDQRTHRLRLKVTRFASGGKRPVHESRDVEHFHLRRCAATPRAGDRILIRSLGTERLHEWYPAKSPREDRSADLLPSVLARRDPREWRVKPAICGSKLKNEQKVHPGGEFFSVI